MGFDGYRMIRVISKYLMEHFWPCFHKPVIQVYPIELVLHTCTLLIAEKKIKNEINKYNQFPYVHQAVLI